MGYGILYLILGVIAIIQIYPLVWLFFFSLKTNQEVFGMSPFSLPQDPQWGNYAKAWTAGHIDVYFFNSVLYTVVAVVLTVILASFVTFAITRMHWKLSGLVLGLFMAGYMI
ncbi:MAG: carbohydrate ABC transporter permease, partial [Bacillus sp. (in: firmicutes)]